jgi:hypothetical protein
MSVKDAVNYLGGGLLGNTLFGDATSVSRFDNVQNNNQMSTAIIIVLIIIIIIIFIMTCLATYKLTNSKLQTFLCFLFGVAYIVIAYIYYGLSGYKLQKK